MQLKVFISSKLQGLKVEREAVKEAVSELWNNENLAFTIWRWESAKEIPSGKGPGKVQSKGVRDSDIYVLIMGSKYGNSKYGESPTHKEYDIACSELEKDRILIYIKEVGKREEKLEQWIEELKNKHTYKSFKNSYQLKDFVKTRLRDVWSSKVKPTITYYPEDPPNVADFVNRVAEQNNLEELIRRKKHMIIIQGIAGIGKTQIAAKLLKNIKIGRDCITYWKEMRDESTFDSVIKDPSGLKGFLRENNDFELADYIEGGGTNHEVIINILLSSLKEKRYALFFDNYQVVANNEVHDLFKRFKDRLTNSTVIITTREPPQFVNPDDEAKVREENVEGFDLKATKEYLEQKGVKISQEQLDKINQKIGGHPLSLRMFASLSLSGEMKIDEIIENLPKTRRLERYLYNEIYKKLSKEEKEVLKALSVFRTSVTADACVQVSKTANVREILLGLSEEKLLVEREKDLYYLHDLIREFSYNMIDKPKEYHRRAGEYYSQLEKTPKNILETTYHKIKDVGVINEEVIDYLMDALGDNYTRFVILGILDSNEIKTPKSFELLEEFLSDENVEIQSFAVSILVKNRHLNIYKTLSILEQIIEGDTSPHLTKRTIQYLSKFGEERLDDILRIIGQIVQSERYEYYWSILVFIKDLGIKSPEIIEILKKIANTELSDLRWYDNRKDAFELLKKMEVDIVPEASKINYLGELRQMTAEEALDYVKKLAHPDEEGKTDIRLFAFDHNFLFFILRELYKVRPEKTSELMKDFLTTLERSPFQHIFEILGEHQYFNAKIIRSFVESDNQLVSLTGFMALEYALNKVVDGKVVKVKEERYLFSWDDVPGDDSKNKELLKFLRDDLNVYWAENAEIRKSNDGMTISISNDENSAEIMINEKKEKATLKIRDVITYDLKAKKENGKLNIYEEIRKEVLGLLREIKTWKEKKYLFSIDARLEEDLNKGIITAELKNIFKTKCPLSDNAIVTKGKESEWIITNKEKFFIRKEDGKLNIYEKKPLLAAMATVTYEEATNPSEQERIGLGTRIGTRVVKSAVELLGPRTATNFMTAVDSETKVYHVVMYWASYRGILHTKPDKLREVFSVIGRGDDMFLRVCNFMYDQLRISPTGALDTLYKFALKSEESQVRNGAIDLANIIGRLAPEKVIEIYEKLLPLPEYQDSRLRLGVTHSFRNFLESSSQGNRARRDLQGLMMEDKDRQVRMLADIILNGIPFSKTKEPSKF